MSLTTPFNVLHNGVTGLFKPEPDKFGGTLPNALRLIAVFLCCAYAIAFPTVVSAMTGYQAELTPYLSVPPRDSGVLVDASQITIPDNVLLGGHRIGLLDNVATATLEPKNEERLLACKKSEIILIPSIYLRDA